MKNDFYLLSFAVCGIKNIEKEVKIDFYNKTIDKSFNPEKFKIKAIYGENGSGKTALISAMQIMKTLILNEGMLNESDYQRKLQKLINKKTEKLTIIAEFLKKGNPENKTDGLEYRFSLVVSKTINGRYEIEKEVLERKSAEYTSAQYKVIYKSEHGDLKEILASEATFEIQSEETYNLLGRTTFTSIVFRNILNKEQITKDPIFYMSVSDVVMFAADILVSLEDSDQHDTYFLTEEMKLAKARNNHDEVYKKMLKHMNLLIRNETRSIWKAFFKKYQEEVGRMSNFLKLFKQDLIKVDIDKKDNGDTYETSLVLTYEGYRIDAEFESTGIKKLIRLFNYIDHAASGGIAFIDEMDSNINDVYLTKLTEYFMEYGKGQLCFTTHNTSPMTVLRRNKKSIDFLSNDNRIISWKTNGNFAPEKLYKHGLIEYLPFNIEPEDFVGVLGE